MAKICKRCGHEIPEGKVNFDIVYEPVSSKGKNANESLYAMKKVTLCLFCMEAFERFMRNQPTTSVRKSNCRKNINIQFKTPDKTGVNIAVPEIHTPEMNEVNINIDPEIIRRQNFIQAFNKENK